jgi:hypothetical protein
MEMGEGLPYRWGISLAAPWPSYRLTNIKAQISEPAEAIIFLF